MKLKELFEDITKQYPIPLESEGLDMSKEARYGRAESLGFDIHHVYYHGTIHNFKSFDPRLSDSARNTGTPLGALVLSSNPVVSASYAGEDTDGWGKVRNYHLGGRDADDPPVREGQGWFLLTCSTDAKSIKFFGDANQ